MAQLHPIEGLIRVERDIGGRTLSLETGFSVSPDPETSMLDSAVGSQRATLRVGQYANDGVLVIDVWKSGEVNV